MASTPQIVWPSPRSASIARTVEPPVVTTSSTTMQRSPVRSAGPSIRLARPCCLASLRTKKAFTAAPPASAAHAIGSAPIVIPPTASASHSRAWAATNSDRAAKPSGRRIARLASIRYCDVAPLVSLTAPSTSACSRSSWSSRSRALFSVSTRIAFSHAIGLFGRSIDRDWTSSDAVFPRLLRSRAGVICAFCLRPGVRRLEESGRIAERLDRWRLGRPAAPPGPAPPLHRRRGPVAHLSISFLAAR